MRRLTILLMLSLCIPAFAQQPSVIQGRPDSVILSEAKDLPSSFRQLELEGVRQQYDATNNAAGMGLAQPSSGSKTELGSTYEWGDWHLAQQGSADLGLGFSTLRYDSFSDKLFMKGSFSYNYDHEKDRKWSDVMDPWFSIPYIYGSSVAKDYDSHNCALSFDLYTAPLAGWASVGLRTDYEVADISGLRDPRPRTGYLGYRLVPSVLFSFGRHHVGLDLGYGYSKEKLSGLTTIQSYPNLYYYKMAGLDHVDGAIAAYSGFKRQFAGSRFLGDLSYGYDSGGFRAMVSGGMEYGRLDSYGDKMQSPGSWNYFLYNMVADVQLVSGSMLHKLTLRSELKDGGADEYLQELTSEKDPETGATTETWVTLYEYINRYILGKYDASLDYTLYGGCNAGDYLWKIEAGAAYGSFVKEMYLPSSDFAAAAADFSLGGSVRLMQNRGHKLELEAGLAYHMAIDACQNLHFDGIYADEVLKPDLAYYSMSAVGARGKLTWLFPLNLGKAGLANGYVSLGGGCTRALPEGGLYNLGVSVGLFTF